MHLWVLVEKDEYELPIAVAETMKEMTEVTGLSRNALYNALKGGKIVKVTLDEDLAEEYIKERK